MISEFKVLGRGALAQVQAGEGLTYLLLHGAGGNCHSYDELLPYLIGKHCVVPALPGRGGSEGPAPISVEEAARWLIEFIGVATQGPLVICGHSYGGALAIELALLSVEAGIDIRALVLIATGARLRVNPMILQITAAAVAEGQAVALGAFAFRPGSDRALVARTDSTLSATPPQAADADWRAADAFDRMQDLGAISTATLILVGEEDQLTPPKYGRFLAESIPGATLSLVPGAGHMLPFECPAQIAQQLDRFVAELI